MYQIIHGALNGIINGSFIVFMLMFLLSIPFGRLLNGQCGLWLCLSVICWGMKLLQSIFSSR